jgi:hypothetical protein
VFLVAGSSEFSGGLGVPARLASQVFWGLGVPPDSPFKFLGGWASRPTRLSPTCTRVLLGVGRPARLAFLQRVPEFSGGWASRPTRLSPTSTRVFWGLGVPPDAPFSNVYPSFLEGWASRPTRLSSFLGVGRPARLAFLQRGNGHPAVCLRPFRPRMPRKSTRRAPAPKNLRLHPTPGNIAGLTQVCGL